MHMLARIRNAASVACDALIATTERPVRYLLEGSWQDEWRDMSMHAGTAYLPQDSMQVDFMFHKLDFVARLKGRGFERIDLATRRGYCIDIGYTPFGGNIQKPATLITEDGRIFHNLSLFSGDGFNDYRLRAFVDAVNLNYECFDSAYAAAATRRPILLGPAVPLERDALLE